MNKDLLISVGGDLSRIRTYPLLDICHYLLTSLVVRDDIQQNHAATPNFPRRHPFSCWLSSMLMCFSGSILTNFLLGESPIKDFLQHQHLLLATICWYLVFYSPIDFVASALRFLPIRILIVVAKEIHRTKRIFDGVHSTLVLYPEGYIIVVLIGAMKGCAGAIMSAVDRFVRGVWLPNQNEFLFPTFTSKACFISSIVFLLEHLKLVRFERELIYLCVVSMFVYVRLITVFFKQYDPLLPFENFSSGILFNSWKDIVSDAYRRATTTATSSTGSSTTSMQASILPASATPLTATTSVVGGSKKDTSNSDGGGKSFEGKKRD